MRRFRGVVGDSRSPAVDVAPQILSFVVDTAPDRQSRRQRRYRTIRNNGGEVPDVVAPSAVEFLEVITSGECRSLRRCDGGYYPLVSLPTSPGSIMYVCNSMEYIH